MTVSIKDVAQRAEVSTATVSHVLNNTRFVSEETKRKVFRAMEELDYRPNSVARSLRSRKSNIIGLIVPILAQDTSNFFFMSVAQGIESVLKRRGYNLLLSNSNESLETEMDQIRVFNSQQIDGLIIAPTSEDHGYLKEFVTGDYPVIFIDRKPKEYEGDCVLVDGEAATYEAARFLIGKGHRRIGYITGPLGLTTSDERLAGYRRALEEAGIGFEERLVKEEESTFESGRRLAKELVGGEAVTALLMANNVMTMGAMGFLREAGIRVPGDAAIIGFDDYKWGEITSPPLTVIRQPSFELGERAAQLLLERIDAPDADNREIRLKAELIVRESC